jgi:hypothetical protein
MCLHCPIAVAYFVNAPPLFVCFGYGVAVAWLHTVGGLVHGVGVDALLRRARSCWTGWRTIVRGIWLSSYWRMVVRPCSMFVQKYATGGALMCLCSDVHAAGLPRQLVPRAEFLGMAPTSVHSHASTSFSVSTRMKMECGGAGLCVDGSDDSGGTILDVHPPG